MQMKRLFVLLMVFCPWIILPGFSPQAVSVAEESEEELRLPLTMEVFLKKPKAGIYDLHVHLTNTSQDAVTVYVHDLPWVPPNDSKWLKVSRMNGKRPNIQVRFPRGKVGSRPIKLQPGESVQDKIALNPRIPTLLEDIERYGIQFHWECPPPDLKFFCHSGSPRVLTILKGDSGKADVYTIDPLVCEHLEQRVGLVDIPKDHEVLFLLTRESVMTDLGKIRSLLLEVAGYVRTCHPSWTNSWGVSFFTDAKYAGFLRDGKSKLLFEKGLWQEANIGQYSSQIRTLFRFPWIKKRSDSVYLSVYR